MSRHCELTGKGPLSGNTRSHAENAKRRVFRPNLVNVTLASEKLGKTVRVRVSANALKSVEHNGGLDGFLTKAKIDTLSPQLQKLKRELAKAADKAA
ncbi:MAG TPA: 50S ribosomal protein L28 [Hyphomicrobiaceae bacterium]|nr:50S ribosomal protein L28 [Hyphomicrobiaceae bacterium]